MATLATSQLEQYIAEQTVKGQTVVFDEFVFANVPNLTEQNLSDYLKMPTSAHIVHRQSVSQSGVVNQNAVVYSVTMGSEIGNFDFNFIGLCNKSLGLLGIAVSTDKIKKVKEGNGEQGNSLTRSILLEFSNAPTLTNITIPAQTWQIDFTARLHGLDEKIRLTNRDLYGRQVFFKNGFKIVRNNGKQFDIQIGSGYIDGVRAENKTVKSITANALPCSIYLDITHHNTVTGAYETEYKFLQTEKADYIDSAGYQHYVQKLADIDVSGNVTDRRNVIDGENAFDGFIPNGKKSSATDSDSEDTVATSKAVRLVKVLIDALTKNLSNYIPNSKKSSAIDSNSEDTVATSAAVKNVNDNANNRVLKSGDTMTGHFNIKNGDYSSVRTYNNGGYSARWESAPIADSNFASIVYADPEDKVLNKITFPKKSGIVAIDSDVVHLSGEEIITGTKVFHYNLKIRSHSDESKLARIGQNAEDFFLQNAYSGMYLQLKNNGEIKYNNNILHHSGRSYVKTSSNGYGGLEVNRAGRNDLLRMEVENNIFKFLRMSNDEKEMHYSIYMQEKSGTLAFLSDIPALNNTVTSESTSMAATAKAVKLAYDKGAAAQSNLDSFRKKFTRTWYGSHYAGTEVYKIPNGDGNYLMITLMNTSSQGNGVFNLPEAYSGHAIVLATDRGTGNILVGSNYMVGNNQVHIGGRRDTSCSILVMGYKAA